MKTKSTLVRRRDNKKYPGTTESTFSQDLGNIHRRELEMEKQRNSDIIAGIFNKITSKIPHDNSAKNYVPVTTGSLKSFYNFFSTVNYIFSDYKLNLYSLVANGDNVTACYYINGIKKSEMMVDSSSSKMTISGIDIFRLDNGKVVDYTDVGHQIKIHS